jgi:hypothetical protein
MKAFELPIDEEFADAVRARLENLLRREVRAARTEIQDNGYFLLVSAEIAEGTANVAARDVLERGAQLLRQEMPSRENDYSWLLNITRHGQVIEAMPGGWVGLSP